MSSNQTDVLFEDQLILSDGRTKPYRILLQLTAESLIIRPRTIISSLSSLTNEHKSLFMSRKVIIRRHSITHSFGFSIKGGRDTGFPILISRISDVNIDLLKIGDAILTLNNEDISDLTHDEFIMKLHSLSDDQIELTVQYMSNMATYLHLSMSKMEKSVLQNCFIIRKLPSINVRLEDDDRLLNYSDDANPKLFIPRVCRNDQNDDEPIDDYESIQVYPLLYAYVSQYLNGTDECRVNAFQLHSFNGSQTGIIIANSIVQQNLWISRISTVIKKLITRKLNEFNQTLISSEHIFYATWLYEQIIHPDENHLPKWQAIFLVFKGSDVYIFDHNQPPPLRSHDFIYCSHVYPIAEVYIQTVKLIYSLSDRRYCFTLILPKNSTNEYRHVSLERKIDYDDFMLNYQRSLYISIYTIQNRTFGCNYQGEICRLIIDIHKGFEMYNNETNDILWSFTFEELQSSSDNGRNKIFFHFKSDSTSTITRIEVECQHLKVLVHVINSFLTVKFIGQHDTTIGMDRS